MTKFEIIFSEQLAEAEIEQQFTNNMNSEQVQIIFSSIESNNQPLLSLFRKKISSLVEVTRLSLFFDQYFFLNGEDYHQISQGIEQLSKLKMLQIVIRKNCIIGDEGISSIFDAILSLKYLNELKIIIKKGNNITINGYKKMKMVLLQKLELQNLTIHYQDNKFTKIDGILEVLEGISCIQDLKYLELDLDIHNFDQSLSALFGRCFKKLSNLNSLSITLKSIDGGEIESSFAQSISELKDLQKLHMIFETNYPLKREITQEFLNSFSMLFDLKDFYISGLISDQDKSNQLDFPNIFQTANQITTLKIDFDSKQKISDDIIFNYANNLRFLKCIESFQLSFLDSIQLKERGLIELLDAIQNMRKLKLLHLVFNTKLSIAAENKIMDILSSLESLKELKLTFGSQTMKERGAKKIAQGLKKQINLETLELEIKSSIQYEGIIEITNSFQSLQNLTNLSFFLGDNIQQIQQQMQEVNENLINSLKDLKFLQVIKLDQHFNLVEDIDLLCLPQLAAITAEYSLIYSSSQILEIKKQTQCESVLKMIKNLSLILSKGYIYGKDYTSYNIEQITKHLKNIKTLNIHSISCQSNSRNNEFNLEAISSLAQLQILNLKIENLDIIAFVSFSKMFEGLLNLKKLALTLQNQNDKQEKLNDKMLEELGKGLMKLSSLEKLKLMLLLPKQKSLKYKFNGLLLNLNKLQKLAIEHIDFNEEQYNDLFQGISQLYSLRILKIKSEFKNNCSVKQILKLNNLKYLNQICFTTEEILDCTFPQFDEQIDDDQINFYQFEEKQINFHSNFCQFQFKNLLELNLIFFRQEDYSIQLLEFILDQIIKQKYLLKLSISMELEYPKINPLQFPKILLNDTNQQEQNEKMLVEENQNNNSLNKFEIKICSQLFGIHHFIRIGNYLSKCIQLQKLKIQISSFNKQGENGLKYLMESLQYLTNLISLEIIVKCNYAFDESAAMKFGNNLSKLQKLVDLSFLIRKQKHLGKDSLNNFALSLKNLVNLMKISLLIKCEISQQVECLLFESISHLTKLKTIKLDLNHNYQINSMNTSFEQISLKDNDQIEELERDINYSFNNQYDNIYLPLKYLEQQQHIQNLFFQIIISFISQNEIQQIASFLRNSKLDSIIQIMVNHNSFLTLDGEKIFYQNNPNLFGSKLIKVNNQLLNQNEGFIQYMNVSIKFQQLNQDLEGSFMEMIEPQQLWTIKQVNGSQEISTCIYFELNQRDDVTEIESLIQSFKMILKQNILTISIEIEYQLEQYQINCILTILKGIQNHQLVLRIEFNTKLSDTLVKDFIKQISNHNKLKDLQVYISEQKNSDRDRDKQIYNFLSRKMKKLVLLNVGYKDSQESFENDF